LQIQKSSDIVNSTKIKSSFIQKPTVLLQVYRNDMWQSSQKVRCEVFQNVWNSTESNYTESNCTIWTRSRTWVARWNFEKVIVYVYYMSLYIIAYGTLRSALTFEEIILYIWYMSFHIIVYGTLRSALTSERLILWT